MGFFSKKKILLSDEELVAKYAQTQHNEYLGELYNRYATLTYGTCMKYLKDPDISKDATMDIFEKLSLDLPKYTISNFRPWLHIVVKNHCFALLKSHKNYVSLDGDPKTNVDEDVENIQNISLHDTSNEETLEALEKALEQLEAAQRQCLTLFYLQKKSYNDIVDETGFTYNEVKSHIQNGKRNLKIKLMKMITSVLVLVISIYR